MKLTSHAARRLAAAAITCTAIALPAALASAGPAGAAGSPAGARQPATVPATVPAAFQPVSAGFYSPASGLVLGGAGCTGGPACRARLAATTDGGARWRSVTGPNVLLVNQAGNLDAQRSRVSDVVFAGRRDGWLYGPGLYATHDGGAHWRKLSLAGGVIDSMAASAGRVYAVVAPPGGKPDELFASPAGGDAWARVGHFTARFSILAVSGRAAWFGNGGSSIEHSSPYVWATADGAHWRKYPVRCPAPYNLNGLASIAAATPSDVFFLCLRDAAAGHQGKAVLASANGGRTAHLAGFAPTLGVGGVIAVPPRRPGLITVATEYAVDHSADGGKTWKQVLFNSGGASLTSLSFVSKNVGWAVLPQGTKSKVVRTTDAGATWRQVRVPAAPAHPVTVYVANQRSDTVTPIRAAANKAATAITVGSEPDFLAITPDGKTAYVINGGSGNKGPATVTPIRTATNTAGKAITVGGYGAYPNVIAITPNGKTAYVSVAGDVFAAPGLVVPIRTATNTAGKAIMVGKFPGAIAITPNGKTAYVADASGVTPIRTATNTALPAIKVGTDPLDIAITPNGKTAYVSSNQALGVSGTVTPINTATNKAGKAIRVSGGASLIAITPNGKTAYVIGDSTVTPINTATNKAGKAIPVGIGPDAIAITPDGKTAYVANQGCGCQGGANADTVSVINTATNKAGFITGFTSPDYIAITPNGKAAYVANGGSDVIPINTSTNKLGRKITVGRSPVAIAITP